MNRRNRCRVFRMARRERNTFCIVFTKADKLGPVRFKENVEAYKNRLLEDLGRTSPGILYLFREKDREERNYSITSEV